jgi:hypothetical protein
MRYSNVSEEERSEVQLVRAGRSGLFQQKWWQYKPFWPMYSFTFSMISGLFSVVLFVRQCNL